MSGERQLTDQERLYRFQHDAVEQLRAECLYAPVGILVLPSFANPFAIIVRADKKLTISRIVWDWEYDMSRFRQIPILPKAPTITTETKPVDKAWFDDMTKRIVALSVPIDVQHGLVLDGIGYEAHFPHCTFKWNHAFPEAWKELVEIANDVIHRWDLEPAAAEAE
jgi:hypothetical protein